MSWILCGLQHCGKTTVGQLLAKKLGWSFIDIDRLIEETDEKTRSCRQIVQEQGEAYFRKLEKKVIFTLFPSSDSVIALGGGSLHDPENKRVLKQQGNFIYLKATPNLLINRFRSLPAHLDSFQRFLEIAKERTPIYEEVAALTVETDHLLPEQIVDQIHSMLEARKSYGK